MNANVATIILFAVMWTGIGSFFFVTLRFLLKHQAQRDLAKTPEEQPFDMGL